MEVGNEIRHNLSTDACSIWYELKLWHVNTDAKAGQFTSGSSSSNPATV
jgi:hypothetical protein